MGLQRELKLEAGNPIADTYLPAIHAAVVSAVDGVVEVQLRELAPGWFLPDGELLPVVASSDGWFPPNNRG